MKTFLKVLKIIGLVFLALVVVLSIQTVRYFNKRAEYVASYKAYSPPCHRNTKWVCQECDAFFVSDYEGQLRGKVATSEGYKPFSLSMSGTGFQMDKRSDKVPDCLGGLFGGYVSYSDGVCVFTYQGEDDEEKYFGDKTGEVTLTFVEEPLPAQEQSRLWDCQECDAFFISDFEGKLKGKVATSEGYKPFSLSMNGEVFQMNKPSDIISNYSSLIFDGSVSYSDGVYVFTYQGEDDEEKYFGDRAGEVTLTFVEKPLPWSSEG